MRPDLEMRNYYHVANILEPKKPNSSTFAAKKAHSDNFATRLEAMF